MIDQNGRVIPREAIDFSRYTPRNFPFRCASRRGRPTRWGR
jgi:hypothetical protein